MSSTNLNKSISEQTSNRQSQQQTNFKNSSNKLDLTIHGKSSIELNYLRRVCVREQKLNFINRKLKNEFPITYFISNCILLGVFALVLISLQIVLIVNKSPLSNICVGIWSGVYLIFCIILVILLELNRSYKYLLITWVCHGIGCLMSLGAIVVVNALDIAYYNASCVFDCTKSYNQYMALIMLVIGFMAFLIFLFNVIFIDFCFFKEARRLNSYLENTK